jgi:hypothetical protein
MKVIGLASIFEYIIFFKALMRYVLKSAIPPVVAEMKLFTLSIIYRIR